MGRRKKDHSCCLRLSCSPTTMLFLSSLLIATPWAAMALPQAHQIPFTSPAPSQSLQPLNTQSDFQILSHPEFSQSVRIRSPKGLCDPAVEQKSGYLDANGRHFYFWQFDSRSDPAKDPVVLW
jgi:carboxypeptidase C (cathepsin A)